MEAPLIRLVWERAEGRCEYCQIGHEFEDVTYEIDHIISQKHEGPTVAENLALSCPNCNGFKGSDISGLDPKTGKLTQLFHPRRQKWGRHFQWEGPVLLGRTASGRVTIKLLKINDAFRVELREGLIEEGVFPPK